MILVRSFLRSTAKIAIALCLLSACNHSDCEEMPQSGCFCIEVYDPVCGCNNVTYSNSCHAECAGITEYTMGKCPN